MKSFWKTKASKAKYGNTKVGTLCRFGFSHRSKLEAAVCGIIWFRQCADEIIHVQHEVSIYLSDARIQYIADFECRNKITDEIFLIEAKGFQSPTWPIKKKLYKYYGPVNLEIWGGTWQNPTLQEVIMPKGKQ